MVFLSFSGADRLQGKSAQKCGPRPSVPRNRRNSSRVRSECAGAGPLGPRGRGTAAAGRVDGARRARAQIPGGGKGLRPAAGPRVNSDKTHNSCGTDSRRPSRTLGPPPRSWRAHAPCARHKFGLHAWLQRVQPQSVPQCRGSWSKARRRLRVVPVRNGLHDLSGLHSLHRCRNCRR